MSFFHNLNKTLDGIAARPEAAQLNERDMSRAAKGYEKYGKEGMQALAKAGREGKSLDPVRNKYDKYDNKEVDEGLVDVVKKVGGMAKKAGNAVLNKVGHGSDVDMIRDLQRKMGVPQTGKKPEQKTDEAAYTPGAGYSPEMQARIKMATPQELSQMAHELAGDPSHYKNEYRNLEAAQSELKGTTKYEEASSPMTAKQKSFAKLAPPADKITFADKIAGAKKEVDEMLGDVAAEAMRNALGGRQQVADEGNAFTGALAKTPKGGKFKVGGKEFTDTSSVDEDDDLNPFTNYKKPRTDTPRTGEVTHGAKHDTKHTATGRVVTRRVDAQGNSVGSETDAEGNTIDKRGRGRPKGPAKGPERTTGKAYKHKGERKVKEDDHDSDEVKQAMAVLKKAGYKVSKAVEEESTHTRDDHAEKAGKRVAKDIEYDEKKTDGIHGKKRGAEDDRAEKAGKKVAKDIEYDDKKDEVKEDEPKKSNSKFKFGGSVYETLDAQLETLITEGMSVTVNMSQNSDDGHPGNKSITVNADGEDAERLAELLQMAGLSQQSGSCSSCGSSPCGCNMVDENDPNWPSNTETSDNALQYSGGLNGPKSTGQSTVPVLASQLRRQVSMEQSAKVEQNLLNLYRTFGK
jgi:hypothetical protein